MPAQGTITISGVMNGFDANAYAVTVGQITFNTANAVGQVTAVTLSSGDNTIALPTGTTALFIQPPTGNTNVLKIKGIAGDTGITISKLNGIFLTFDTPAPANIIVNASAAFTTPVHFIFM